MANKEWTLVNGVNNADDSGVSIVARLNGSGNTEVAFTTGYGVKVVEVTGDLDLTTALTSEIESILAQAAQEMGSDALAIVAVQNDGEITALGICDMDDVITRGKDLDVAIESSDEYEPENYTDMEEEYPGLATIMGLGETE